jgi:hypothetical protein
LEVVREIIRLGTLAPTACNRQGWRFIIINHKDAIASLVTLKGGAKFIRDAPMGILVLYHRYSINPFYDDNAESASACIQNMVLAATEAGLGSCWVNNLPPKPYLRRTFDIPKEYDIVAFVTLGYPLRKPGLVKRKYDTIDDLSSYNGFGEPSTGAIETRKPRSTVGMAIVLVSAFLVSKLPEVIRRLLPARFVKRLKNLVRIDHPFPEEYDNLDIVEYRPEDKPPE